MGSGGFLYSDKVEAFGVVAARRNCDRPSSSARRRELAPVDNKKCFLLLLSGEALVSAENEIADRLCIDEIFFIMIMIYHCSEKELWAGNDLVWLGI